MRKSPEVNKEAPFLHLTKTRDEDEAFISTWERDAARKLVRIVIRMRALQRLRRRFQRIEVLDVRAKLAELLIFGHIYITSGLQGTGKTNFSFLVLEAARDTVNAHLAANVQTQDQSIAYVTSKAQLLKWVKDNPGPKAFLFSDASLFYSSRRSGASLNTWMRELQALARKFDLVVIWETWFEFQIDKDVQFFATWKFKKPFYELGEDVKAEKGQVPLWIKRIVWFYQNKGGRQRKFVAWSQAVPLARTIFNSKDWGTWEWEGEGKQDVQQVAPILEGEAFRSYAVRRAGQAYGNEAARFLELAFKQTPQDEIAKRVGASQPTVSRTLRKIRTSGIGYWFEDWYCQTQGVRPNPDKNQSVPDCVLEDRVVSLKTWMSYRPWFLIYPERDLAPEIQAGLATGKRVLVLAYHAILDVPLEYEIDLKRIPRTITFNFESKNIRISE